MNPGDEKKLKDLTDRLMAMSPEPPPFPEEPVVASSGNQSRRTSPFLVFAGAAAVVLLAIGIPFLFFDNEPPVAAPDTTTSTTSTTVDQPTTTTTTPGETTTTTTDGQIPIAGDAVVYLVTMPENGFNGNPAVVSFATPAFGGPDTDLTLYALQLLAPVGIPITAPEGYFNAVPDGVEIYSARVADGAPNVLIVETNEKFLEGGGGLLADFTMLNQLIYTATQSPDIDEVQFIVNNQPVTQFGSEGLNLSSSVGREDFRDELSIINVTEPVTYVSDGPVRVAGISQTFEAEMSIRVLNSNGEIVYEDHMMTTDGAPSWGEYEFVLDGSTLGPNDVIQLLNYSAENGEPGYVVSVPLNDGPWDFSGGFTN